MLAATSLDAQATAQNRTVLVDRLDSIVRNAMEVKTAGIQVAVVKGRDTLLMKGYGIADAEDSIGVTPQTVFKIGSVTKQFTSAAIMQLIEQGKLTLDDTLGKFMPNAPRHWHRVTIFQLLNHTSGIPSLTDVGPKAGPALMMGMKRDSIFELLRGDSLMFPPGKGFYYNNTGYILLGMLVEQLSGKTYKQYLEGMVAPLGLTQTSYCGGREIIRHMANGYDRQGSVLINASPNNMETPFSAGSMCSTARDLVKWGHALSTGKVVSAASFRTMTTPVKFSKSFPMTYGFALTADTIGSLTTVQHGGNINGFSSHLFTVPSESLYVAVNINVSGAPAPIIAQEIARAILGKPRTVLAARDEPITQAERALFVGKYSIGIPTGARREFVVGEQDNHLTLIPPGQSPLVLERYGKQWFAVKGRPTQRILFEMEGEKVTGIMLDQGVRPLIGVKVQ